jgi:8-oxo-dGTP pyrophosphatase MutT (NUDIX family)
METTAETPAAVAPSPPVVAPTAAPTTPPSRAPPSPPTAGPSAHHHSYQHRHHRSNKSAGVILIDPWSYNYNDPATYRIMVVQQKGSGVWGLPKGHLEPDETLYEAALREMREETGVHLLSDHDAQSDAPVHEGALREHVDFVPVPLKMVPMVIQEAAAAVNEGEAAAEAADNDATATPSESPREDGADATTNAAAPKPPARAASLYRNHVQIKKIHFFVFVLRRSGQSLVPAPVDSHEIIRVSWLNVQSWNVDALECLRAAGYAVPVPKFNRTLSDGAVTTLQEVARKVGVQMATQTRGATAEGGGGGYGGRFRGCDFLF